MISAKQSTRHKKNLMDTKEKETPQTPGVSFFCHTLEQIAYLCYPIYNKFQKRKQVEGC